MIEIIEAKDGSNVLRVNGKLTESKYDPQKNCEDWLRGNQYVFDKYDHVVFLGIGSGHHIRSYVNKYPGHRILIIEKNKELIDYFKEEFLLITSQVEIQQITDMDQIFVCDPIGEYLRNNAFVVEYTGAMNAEGTFYYQIKRLLVGRDPDYFSKFLGFFPQYEKSFRPFLRVVESRKNLLSIKDLEKIVQSDEENNNIQNRIKILRELVV